jgi:hypothetical protein
MIKALAVPISRNKQQEAGQESRVMTPFKLSILLHNETQLVFYILKDSTLSVRYAMPGSDQINSQRWHLCKQIFCTNVEIWFKVILDSGNRH